MKIVENNDYFLEALQTLPTAQLSKILRQELGRSHKDKALILKIWNTLEHKHASSMKSRQPNDSDAWASYQTTCAAAEEEKQKSRRTACKRWVISAAATAAIVCLIVTVAPKIEATRNLMEAFGKWTHEVFSFFSHEKPDNTLTFDDPTLQEIYEEIADAGVTAPVVPTWIPEGFTLEQLNSRKSPKENKIFARLESSSHYILLTYELDGETVANQYTKGNVSVEAYEINNVVHNLMSNEEVWKAVWQNDGIECAVATNLSREELCQILQSIYRR